LIWIRKGRNGRERRRLQGKGKKRIKGGPTRYGRKREERGGALKESGLHLGDTREGKVDMDLIKTLKSGKVQGTAEGGKTE